MCIVNGMANKINKRYHVTNLYLTMYYKKKKQNTHTQKTLYKIKLISQNKSIFMKQLELYFDTMPRYRERSGSTKKILVNFRENLERRHRHNREGNDQNKDCLCRFMSRSILGVGRLNLLRAAPAPLRAARFAHTNTLEENCATLILSDSTHLY